MPATTPQAPDEPVWLGWNANTWARAAALLVLILGTTIVVVPAAMKLDRLWADPYDVPRTVVVEVTESDGLKTTKTTTAEAKRSFVERSLAASGLFLLRIGVVALAAFLAGAIVQRTLLGNFAFKIGPLEVPEIARTTEGALTAVGGQLRKQAEATEEALRASADATEAVRDLATQVEALKASAFVVLPSTAGTPSGRASSKNPRDVEEEKDSPALSEGIDIDVQLEAEPEEEHD